MIVFPTRFECVLHLLRSFRVEVYIFSTRFECNFSCSTTEAPVLVNNELFTVKISDPIFDSKITLETSGEDAQNTLQTCGENAQNTLQTSGEDVESLKNLIRETFDLFLNHFNSTSFITKSVFEQLHGEIPRVKIHSFRV